MQIRKMGPIGNLLGMLPGMGQMKEQLDQIDDRTSTGSRRSSSSMTPEERADPKILNGSRRPRIAKGSGVTVTEVNNLVDRFFEARKMMRQMAGRSRNCPECPALAVSRSNRKKKGKGASRSGDPRKQ